METRPFIARTISIDNKPHYQLQKLYKGKWIEVYKEKAILTKPEKFIEEVRIFVDKVDGSLIDKVSN